MSLYCPICGNGYESGNTCPVDGSPLLEAKADDDRLGQLVHGRFRLIEEIGSGGAGRVFRAIQQPIGREVAVKILHGAIHANPTEQERFIREARMASSLRHPNIVSPVDFGEDRDLQVLFFAMEYVEGVDLRDLLDGTRRVTLDLALEILFQTAGALTEAHDKGVIHRDLKPGNLRLVAVSDGSLQVKVLDLGIARTMEGTENITETGNITGTIAYLPPEYMTEGTLVGSSDFYSMGIILYEMIVGHKPFNGNYLQVMFHHIKTEAPPLNMGLPDGEVVDPAVEAFYRKLVAKSPDDRIQDARQLREEIKALRHHLGLQPPHLKEPKEEISTQTFRAFFRKVGVAHADDAPPKLTTNVKGDLKRAASLWGGDPEASSSAKIRIANTTDLKKRLRRRLLEESEATTDEPSTAEPVTGPLKLSDNWGILDERRAPTGLQEESFTRSEKVDDNWGIDLPDDD